MILLVSSLNTSKICDNDALLFFSIIIKDVQEHFYNNEFTDKYLVTRPDSYTYNTEAISKILEKIGMSEEEVMSKFDLESSKKISQSFKRWRYLFLQNDPASIVLKNEEAGDVKKQQILKNLEEYIIARVNTEKMRSWNERIKERKEKKVRKDQKK